MGREINFAIFYSHQFWDRLPLIAVTAAAILVDFSSVEYWLDKLVFVHFFLKSVIDTKKQSQTDHLVCMTPMKSQFIL